MQRARIEQGQNGGEFANIHLEAVEDLQANISAGREYIYDGPQAMGTVMDHLGVMSRPVSKGARKLYAYILCLENQLQ